MNGRYVLDANHNLVPVEDLMEWAKRFERADRHVNRTMINNFTVSTVFLGLDHQWGDGPPLVFETMVFDKPGHDIYQRRCSTWEQAEKQHQEAVDWVNQKAQP